MWCNARVDIPFMRADGWHRTLNPSKLADRSQLGQSEGRNSIRFEPRPPKQWIMEMEGARIETVNTRHLNLIKVSERKMADYILDWHPQSCTKCAQNNIAVHSKSDSTCIQRWRWTALDRAGAGIINTWLIHIQTTCYIPSVHQIGFLGSQTITIVLGVSGYYHSLFYLDSLNSNNLMAMIRRGVEMGTDNHSSSIAKQTPETVTR